MRGSIPSFYLYGEPHRIAEEGFVHVETLDDRSRPSEWTIEAHAHKELNHIIFIAEGGGEMRADEHLFSFTAPCLLLVPAALVHGFAWRAESEGSVMTISNSYVAELVRRDPEAECLFRAPASIPVDLKDAAWIMERIEDLTREFSWLSIGHRTAVDAAILPVILFSLRKIRRVAEDEAHATGRHADIVARFRERVEARFRHRDSIAQHAAALRVSNTALRVACARIARVPPARIADERSLLEAKRGLLYSNLSISEIAYSLGFNSVAYFSRFFSRHAGVSPRDFRRQKSRLPVT